MREARAFWIAEPGRGEIRAEQLPAPTADDVVVRAVYSGISRGTEALIFDGRVPRSEYARMRAPFQAGDFPAPVKYGYANVGRVEEGPPELRDRLVFVLYPHQTRYVVPARSIYALPEGVPAGRAVLAANLETAINGLWDGRPQVGDRISVIGGGTVGCLVAWLAARIPGAKVELVDVNPGREHIAAVLNVGFATPDKASPDADLVVHASGTSEGLNRALKVAGVEATIVEMSWHGDSPVSLALGEAFHVRRLKLISSQVGAVPSSQHPRWDTHRRMQLALTLLADPTLDILISGESDFDALPEVMAELARGRMDGLCHRIRYS